MEKAWGEVGGLSGTGYTGFEPERVEILGVGVSRISVEDLHEAILAVARRGKRALVLNANVHCINLAYHRPWLRTLLNDAPIVFCDGAGISLAARILGHPPLVRFTYADEMWRLAAFAEDHGLSLFFLGARPGVAEEAAFRLRERYPGLRIVGVRHGFFDPSPGSPENEAVIQEINASKPDILVVGLGMPLQEWWLWQNHQRLDARVSMNLGAVFDYVSGRVRRGPRFLVNNGFEWLARLLIEPRRLWRRYVVGNPIFLLRVVRQRLSLDSRRSSKKRAA